MRRIAAIPLLCLISGLAMGWWPGASTEPERFWPQWRGPHATGVAPFGDPPVEWSEDRNVKWKVAIPGKGSSSPIVWGDRVFVTTAVSTGKKAVPPKKGSQTARGRRFHMRGIEPTEVQKFAIFAIDRKSGKVLWQRTLREELPHEGTHPTGTWASNSPVTDGEHVYAYFGSRGLYCLDWEGNLIWEKDLGDMTIKLGFGEGSSPFLYGDKIVLTWDHEGPSFTIALDKKTGKELWRASREEETSWTTPVVVQHGGKPQVVTSATNRVRSYDLARRCCVIRARGEPGREAHPPQHTRSDRGIPSSAIRFSTAHLIAASTFWFLTVRAERLTPSIALYRETAFSATLWRVQPLDFRHS